MRGTVLGYKRYYESLIYSGNGVFWIVFEFGDDDADVCGRRDDLMDEALIPESIF